MDRTSLEQHWNEVRTRLLLLRRLLSGNSEAEEVLDEFIDHNELGLALHTICDALLECDQAAIENEDIEAIEFIHERMQIADGSVAAIRQHRNRTS
jgi:hypothetical protein